MFSYGINTNTDSMRHRCPDARLVGPAWLDGYAFRWRRFADIELDDDMYVIGLLWEISDEDLSYLDHFEGVPGHYTRQKVRISSSGGDRIGWTYIMANQGAEIAPDRGYRDAVFEGYRSNQISDQQLLDGLSRLGIDAESP